MQSQISNYGEFQRTLATYEKDAKMATATQKTSSAELAARNAFSTLEANPLFAIRHRSLLNRISQQLPLEGDRIHSLEVKLDHLENSLALHGIHFKKEEDQKESEQKEGGLTESLEVLTNSLETALKLATNDTDKKQLEEQIAALKTPGRPERELLAALINDQPVSVGLCDLDHCLQCYWIVTRALGTSPQFDYLADKVLILLKSHFLIDAQSFLNNKIFPQNPPVVQGQQAEPQPIPEANRELIYRLLDKLTKEEIDNFPEGNLLWLEGKPSQAQLPTDIHKNELKATIADFLSDPPSRAKVYRYLNNPVLALSWAKYYSKPGVEKTPIKVGKDAQAVKEFYGLKPPAPVEVTPIATSALIKDNRTAEDFTFRFEDGGEVRVQSFLVPLAAQTVSQTGVKELTLPHVYDPQIVKDLVEIASGTVQVKAYSREIAHELAALATLLKMDTIAAKLTEGLNAANSPDTLYYSFSEKEGLVALRDIARRGSLSLEEPAGMIPDMVIKCSGNKEVKVHSLIVDSALKSNKESNKALSEMWSEDRHALDLSRYPEGAVNLLLDFWYTGRLEGSYQDLLELYRMADELKLNLNAEILDSLRGVFYKDKTLVPKALLHALNVVYKSDNRSPVIDFLLDQMGSYSDLNQLNREERIDLIQRCEVLAKNGDGIALLIMGICTYLWGGEAEIKTAREIFEKSSKMFPLSLLSYQMLALMTSLTPDSDYHEKTPKKERVKELLTYAADRNHMPSIFALLAYEHITIEDFKSKYEVHCRYAARELNNAYAQACLAKVYGDPLMYEELEKIAQDQKNTFLLDIFAARRMGTNEVARGIQLFQQSAQLGSFDAKGLLAFYQFFPWPPEAQALLGPVQDKRLAFQYAQESAAIGFSYGKYALSLCYKYGVQENQDVIVAVNPERAATLWQEAMDREEPEFRAMILDLESRLPQPNPPEL